MGVGASKIIEPLVTKEGSPKRPKSPAIEIIHDKVPGRVRFRLKGLHHNSRLKAEIEIRLTRRLGVREARASELTGNVLVVFDPSLDFLEIVSELTSPRAVPKPIAWHRLSARETAAQLGSSLTAGLSPKAASTGLSRHGANVVASQPQKSGIALFGKQLKSFPVALLGVSAGLSIATGGLADAAVILVVIGANAALGYLTESRTHRMIQSLSRKDRRQASVIRRGKKRTVPVDEVVPGDLLVLSPGSYVPADARLVSTERLTLDESLLTGESLPVPKSAETLDKEEVPLAERANMVHRGTIVTGGSALAVAVATGVETEVGRIQKLLIDTEKPLTPMQIELRDLGQRLVSLTCLACGGVLLAGIFRGYRVLDTVKITISLAVAAIPEGLPAIATSSFALSILRLRKRGVLVRHIPAVEALGAVEALCLDKTGTLTFNRMSVAKVITSTEALSVIPDTHLPTESSPELLRLIVTSVLCSEATAVESAKAVTLSGSSTEQALLELAFSAGLSLKEVRETFPLTKLEHRAEGRNFMRTWHQTDDGHLVAVKGSPDEVLKRCQWIDVKGQKIPLSDEKRAELVEENNQMAHQALRVLGIAYGLRKSPEEDRGLIWVGMVGLSDPVRPEVKDLISRLHRAGIETLMITGDQTATAETVAREAEVEQVFARVTPSRKLQIVQELQANGKVIAMTGDGINDGPALKAADIGIAMQNGSDTAREVGDIVLKDDNLVGLLEAIREGRATYDNVKKSVKFVLATNMSELSVVLSSVAVGMGQPFQPMQLLWLNLVTDVFPALALAVEPPDADIMERTPRKRNSSLLSSEDYRSIANQSARMTLASLASYGYGAFRYGLGSRAGTLALTTLTSGQLAHTVRVRSRGGYNPYLFPAVGASFALQLLSVVVPSLRRLTGNSTLSGGDWLVAGVFNLISFLSHNQGGNSNGIPKK